VGDDRPVWGVLSLKEKIRIIEPLLRQGWSTREIAMTFLGATKNSIIGFSHRHISARLRTPYNRRRDQQQLLDANNSKRVSVSKALPEKAKRVKKGKGLTFNPIQKIFSDRKSDPRNPASLPSANLVRFSMRKMGRECAYISGSPTEFAMCCGLPVVNSELCAEHLAKCWRPAERSR